MSAIPPGANSSRSLWQSSLDNWPLVGRPIRTWRALILANSSARREAKAVLFAELAEAARQGMPLHLALATSSQSVREASRAARPELAPGANSRDSLQSFFSGLAMYLFAQSAIFLYILLSFRMVDVERIARLLALRLHAQMSKGLSLSTAMKRCEPDYEEQEIRLAEAGEQWNNLPQALRRLAEFQVTEARLTTQGWRMLYPVWLGLVLFTLGSFCLVFIVPKFKDIYDQLGAELPGLTSRFVEAGYLMVNPPGYLVPILTGLFLGFLLLRALMNGNRLSKYVLLSPFVVLGAVLLGVVGGNFLDTPLLRPLLNNPAPVALMTALLVALMALGLMLIVPEFLAALEGLVLRTERAAAPLFRRLPLVGTAAQAEAEARWLAALAVALESGVGAPEAVLSAGRVCGGSLGRRSERAADLVASGQTIGQACIAVNVLHPEVNHRLRLLDSYQNYTAGLRTVAEDMGQAAFEKLYRSGRIGEVVVLLLLGLVVAAFAVSLYLPLFNIPKIVIRAGQL